MARPSSLSDFELEPLKAALQRLSFTALAALAVLVAVFLVARLRL